MPRKMSLPQDAAHGEELPAPGQQRKRKRAQQSVPLFQALANLRAESSKVPASFPLIQRNAEAEVLPLSQALARILAESSTPPTLFPLFQRNSEAQVIGASGSTDINAGPFAFLFPTGKQ